MMSDPLASLFSARSHEESRQILASHPALLESGPDEVLRAVLADARASGHLLRVHTAERIRLLLRRCRELGAAVAFDELTGHAMERFMDLLAQARVPLDSVEDPDRLDQHVDAHLQLFHHPGTAVADPELRSAVFGNAAAALQHRFERLGRLDDLHRRSSSLWPRATSLRMGPRRNAMPSHSTADCSSTATERQERRSLCRYLRAVASTTVRASRHRSCAFDSARSGCVR